jgi:hypothetical protein
LCFVYLYCPPAAQAHYIKVDTRQLKEAYHRMGPMSFPQKVILVDFVGLALLWYLNSPSCVHHIPFQELYFQTLWGSPPLVRTGSVARGFPTWEFQAGSSSSPTRPTTYPTEPCLWVTPSHPTDHLNRPDACPLHPLTSCVTP